MHRSQVMRTFFCNLRKTALRRNYPPNCRPALAKSLTRMMVTSSRRISCPPKDVFCSKNPVFVSQVFDLPIASFKRDYGCLAQASHIFTLKLENSLYSLETVKRIYSSLPQLANPFAFVIPIVRTAPLLVYLVCRVSQSYL